ncbi:MAG: DNA translocase FtsK [Intestinibacillus sp.]
MKDLATKKPSATTRKSPAARTGSRAKQPQKRSGVRREVWALLYALLAVVTFLCLGGFDGFVLKWLRQGCGALIGVGLFVLPFTFAGLAALLLTQRKGPVRLRAACVALTPVLLGAIIQAVMRPHEYQPSIQVFAALIKSGMELTSGGLLGGLTYVGLEWAVSAVGALLILILLMITALLVIFRLTPGAIWRMLKSPEYEYEDEEERQKYETPRELPNIHVVAAARAQKRARRQVIDIPLDGEEPTPAAAPEDHRPPSPADYLESLQEEPAAPVSVPAPEPAADTAPSSDDAFGDILSLVQKPAAVAPAASGDGLKATQGSDTPPWEEPKKPDKKEEAAQAAALAAEMSASQQTPPPAYAYPPITLLSEPKAVRPGDAKAELAESSQRLLDTLQSFGVDAQIINIVRGPSVTRFELTIQRGIKFSRITALADDIALSLGAVSVRIAPIPDKVAVGIEVPNKSTATVFIREVIGSRAFQTSKSRLSFAVGKDITGAAVIGDIAKMPHMLIAGTTGSGKSVCINSMLISLLYKSTPEEVRLIMVDPKMVELGNYNGIPHLLIPVVTDPKKASGALNWAVGEMERRYKLFADNQVRNLVGYNELMRRKRAEAEQLEGGAPEQYNVLPQIVIVIDELADLMMVAAKEVETSICRIAQKARAAGMHLVVATQRPSADVITGIMKANIPSRVAFAVASQIESRIILDTTGAEKLIGKGDMLYAPLGEGKPRRVQGCFISNDEIEDVIAKVKESQAAEYSEEILEHIERQAESGASGASGAGGDPAEDEDELLMEAIDVVIESRQASVSMLQRRLKLGYSRAARIVDQMEERGIVGPFEGSKPRQLLISREEWQEMKLRRSI